MTTTEDVKKKLFATTFLAEEMDRLRAEQKKLNDKLNYQAGQLWIAKQEIAAFKKKPPL